MKISIILLAFAAVAVNGQSPFDIYFSSLFNRPQVTQPQYQSYQPYQILSTTRRPYVAVATTPASTKFLTYKSPNTKLQSYKPYLSTTTRRPFIPVVSTQKPTLIPSYSAGVTPQAYNPIVVNPTSAPVSIYKAPQPYRPYQILTPTLRPYIPLAPTTLQPYKAPIFIAPTAPYYNSGDRSANTLRSENQINPDGSYNWFFETDNGIVAGAQGSLKSVGSNPYQVANDVRGSFSWTAPNGVLVSYTYTADENGYHPQRAILGARN